MTSATASPAVDKFTNTTPLLIAQNINCSVVNIRTGQLALRFSPNGKSRAGLDNGNTVESLRGGSGVWRYIRVLDGPNRRINGLEGWVNSNYLACGGVDDSGDFMNVRVFDPPSNIRTSPNGNVKCTIARRRTIQVYVEPQNGWYSTTACGGGWIHESQIRY
ncbi:SH3 domain-containing protein [Chroococcidiopsidales cyanobacterium LEGE 13417]|uniref:SH3 domain-containing protein n=1 Tax=Chroococcidiopsis sp. CCALA 051 TaxID=869949 RepID=UPI000D0CCF3C|nr:SH3 domain-containing protein [Chroococcidiopsis sp. CCALA 051]MBE9018964.1 SH3 domain-containing protein [Chroococcidiopsidales cyanobacterium LEGE 13417]